MVRPRMVGPDLPSGLRRPDRSVDLRSMPVQQMGLGVFNWGGYGNPPAIWRRGPGGPSWSLTSNAESRRFIAAVAEQMRREGKDMPPPGSDAGFSVDDVHEYLGKSPRYIALSPEGGIVDDVPEPGPEAAVDPERDPEPAWEAPPDAGNLLSVGAAAGGAQVLANTPVPNFQGPQVHAMAGGGPPNWQEDLPLGDRPGRRLTPAQIAAGQAGVETGKGILGGTIPAPPDPDAGLPPAGPESEQGTLWDPESQMDRQLMAEMAAQRGAQPEHGYFGAAGSAVSGVVDDLSSMVQGMSAGERAAMISALVAAGLLMVGSGGTLIPIGLGAGAGLGAMSSAP